jgi:O-antigen/teichoic acid export membrane protein
MRGVTENSPAMRLGQRLRARITGSAGQWEIILGRTLGGLGFRVAATGLSFLLSIVLARAMGVSEFGTYVFVLSVTGLASTFITLGLPGLLMREIARARGGVDWGEVRGLARFASRVTLGGALLVWLGIIAYAARAHPSTSPGGLLREPLVLGGALLPLSALIALNSARLTGFEHVLTGQSLDSLFRPALLLLLAVMAWLGLGGLTAPLALALQCGSAVAVAVLGGFLVHHLVGTEWATRLAGAQLPVRHGPWLKAGFFLALGQFLVNISFQIDILMLKMLADESSVAIYFAAARGVHITAFFYGVMSGILAPTVARLAAVPDYRGLENVLVPATISSTAVTVFVSAGFLLFGKVYLGLYGPAFVDGYSALVVLTVMWCICVASGFGLVLVSMTGHEKVGVAAMSFGICGNIILNYLLIPRLGLLGAAIGTAFQGIVSPIILVWYCWFRFNIRIDVMNSAVHYLRRYA